MENILMASELVEILSDLINKCGDALVYKIKNTGDTLGDYTDVPLAPYVEKYSTDEMKSSKYLLLSVDEIGEVTV